MGAAHPPPPPGCHLWLEPRLLSQEKSSNQSPGEQGLRGPPWGLCKEIGSLKTAEVVYWVGGVTRGGWEMGGCGEGGLCGWGVSLDHCR